MRKRLLAAVLVIGTAAGVLAGCGGKQETSIVGEWSVTKIRMEGMDEVKPVEDAVREMAEAFGGEVSDENVQLTAEAFTGIVLEVKGDGSAVMNDASTEETMEGSWSETDDDVYTINFGGEDVTFILDGDELIVEEDGEAAVVFEK